MPRDNTVIAIVHSDVPPDAPADEQDTLLMAAFIEDLMRESGRRGVRIPYRPDRLERDLAAAGTGLIFNLVESIDGKGDALERATDLFARLGYAFTGTGSEGLRATANKLAAKDIFHRYRLPTPAFLDEAGIERAGTLSTPFILKSITEEASFGIFADSITGDADRMRNILSDRKNRYGGTWFAEQFIDGREFHVSLLEGSGGARVLPPAEIGFAAFPPDMPRIVDYKAKWDETSFQYNNTPYLFSSTDAALRARLEDMALRCWDAFSLNGSARIDFRLAGDGALYILDINANPCLAAHCVFYAAAREAGLSYGNIVDALIAAAYKVKSSALQAAE